MKVITHNDRFHADDVFAMAALRIKFGKENIETIRTRDEDVIKSGDIVFDVGNIYDESTNRFDHHQTEGAGVRENGIPYASFGLVWKKWGIEICDSQEAMNIVDKKIVQSIDAGDNGYSFYEYTQEDMSVYTLNAMVSAFGATWKEQERYDEVFQEVVDIAEKILRREIILAQHKVEAVPLVEDAYSKSEDKRIAVLDEYYPWHDTLSKYEELLFVVSPNKEKTMWRINAVQKDLFVNKKDLPKEWAGLRTEELEKVTGVTGALFCHRKLFMAATNSKESALILAKKAIEL